MKRNNIIVGQGYTIPVCSIVEQIWMDGHPDEEFDQLEPPTWKEGLERIEEQIAYARPEIFYFDYPYYGDAPLLAQCRLISSPAGTEMFHFPAYGLGGLCVHPPTTPHEGCRVAPFGYPRINAR